MKYAASLCIAALFLITVVSCNKDNTDLTKSIVGTYTNTANSTTIVVNRIDDGTVSMAVSSETGSKHYAVNFSSVKINSETLFTLNSDTFHDPLFVKTYYGSGIYGDNKITLYLSIHYTPTDSAATLNYSAADSSKLVPASK